MVIFLVAGRKYPVRVTEGRKVAIGSQRHKPAGAWSHPASQEGERGEDMCSGHFFFSQSRILAQEMVPPTAANLIKII